MWPRWADRRVVVSVLVAGLLLGAVPFALEWIRYRFTHSITEDAFVESHLVNVGPQVAGHLVEIFVEEHDTVTAGQLLARIDPLPYQRQVELAAARLAVAQAAVELGQAALDRLSAEVPRRVAIAEKEWSVAQADATRAERNLELTRQDVEKLIHEAQATVEAARAILVNADEDYQRYTRLYREKSVPDRKYEEATKTWKTARADLNVAEAKLARAEAARLQVDIAAQAHLSATRQAHRAEEALGLAKLGDLQIAEARRQVQVKQAEADEARRALAVAQTNLDYTRLIAPFPGVVVKRYRNLGDFAAVGAPVLSLYNTELLYVTANMEETRLEGVAPGNGVRLDVDAFREPFRGRVLWIGKATAANFALIPRDVSVGEFTKVVQRVPIRILIDRDDRWPQLRPGLSVTVAIEHGPGDPDWARKAAREELRLERGPTPEPMP